jgi:hypothetical protein
MGATWFPTLTGYNVYSFIAMTFRFYKSKDHASVKNPSTPKRFHRHDPCQLTSSYPECVWIYLPTLSEPRCRYWAIIAFRIHNKHPTKSSESEADFTDYPAIICALRQSI